MSSRMREWWWMTTGRWMRRGDPGRRSVCSCSCVSWPTWALWVCPMLASRPCWRRSPGVFSHPAKDTFVHAVPAWLGLWLLTECPVRAFCSPLVVQCIRCWCWNARWNARSCQRNVQSCFVVKCMSACTLCSLSACPRGASNKGHTTSCEKWP